MKTKILKRMLAVLISASAIMAAPGLAGALSQKSREYIEHIKTLNFSPSELPNVINNLKEIAKEDDEAKNEVAGAIWELAEKDLLKSCSPEEITKIVEILKECNDMDKSGGSFFSPYAISEMAEKDLLKSFSQEELLPMTNRLIKDLNSYENSYDAARAVGYLAEKGLLNSYSSEEIMKIINALLTAQENALEIAKREIESGSIEVSPLPNITRAVAGMTKNGLFDTLPHDQIFQITNALIEYKHYHDASSIFSKIVAYFARKGLFNELQKDQILRIIDALKFCTINKNSEISAAATSAKLSLENLLNKKF